MADSDREKIHAAIRKWVADNPRNPVYSVNPECVPIILDWLTPDRNDELRCLKFEAGMMIADLLSELDELTRDRDQIRHLLTEAEAAAWAQWDERNRLAAELQQAKADNERLRAACQHALRVISEIQVPQTTQQAAMQAVFQFGPVLGHLQRALSPAPPIRVTANAKVKVDGKPLDPRDNCRVCELPMKPLTADGCDGCQHREGKP